MSSTKSSNKSVSYKSSVKKSSRSRTIKLANHILRISHQINSSDLIKKQISSIDELDSNVFIFMYENICEAELIGTNFIFLI